MLKETAQSTYIYNAQGHALSGHVTQPVDQFIEVQAGMSLPTDGGVGTARVDNFRFREFVSFSAGYTHVSGVEIHKDTFATLVTATVENLKILDVVTADRVVARVASTHDISGRKPDPEPQITLFGSTIENLKIAGCPVHLTFADELFLRLKTFDAIRNEFQKNAEFRRIAADPFLTGKPKNSVELDGVVLCSLVKDMTIDCKGITRKGHALVVPEFGKVFIGEVIARHRKRTVTMLRMELGCPVTGTMMAAQGGGNGHPWP
jgi:hypothetical protein